MFARRTRTIRIAAVATALGGIVLGGASCGAGDEPDDPLPNPPGAASTAPPPPTPSPTPGPPRTFTTDTGVRLDVQEWGSGPKAAGGQSVTMHYDLFSPEGLGGVPLDTTRDDPGPVRFVVGEDGPPGAWSDAARVLPAGTRAILTAPPERAFGSRGLPNPRAATDVRADEYLIYPGEPATFIIEIIAIN